MAITTEQFDALTPSPYQAVRDKLQTGDVLLFHSEDLTSWGIEYFTDSLWSHASILLRLREIDRVLIMECINGAGVRMLPLSTRINGVPEGGKPYNGKLLLARHQQFPSTDVDKIHTLTEVALERLGYPYSGAELIKIAERICDRLEGRTAAGLLSENGRYICSEYVAMCYQQIGIDIRPDKEGFMAPADIADDPNVDGVFSIVPDVLSR